MAFRVVLYTTFCLNTVLTRVLGLKFSNTEQKGFGFQFTASVLQSALDILMWPDKLYAAVSCMWHGNQYLPQLSPLYYHLFTR